MFKKGLLESGTVLDTQGKAEEKKKPTAISLLHKVDALELERNKQYTGKQIN